MMPKGPSPSQPALELLTPSSSSSCPTKAQAYNHIKVDQSSQINWGGHTRFPTETFNGLASSTRVRGNYPHSIYGDSDTYPAQGPSGSSMEIVPSVAHHQSVSYEQPASIGFPDFLLTSHFAPHAYSASHFATQASVGSLAVQQMDPYYGMRSLGTVEGRSNLSYPRLEDTSTPIPHNTEAPFWTRTQYSNQQSLRNNSSNHDREPTLREIPAATARATPTSTPAATESGINAQGLYYPPPPQWLSSRSFSHPEPTHIEVSRPINVGGIDGSYSQPSAEGAQRKRKRGPDLSHTFLGSSRRRIEAIEAAPSDIQRRAVGMTQSGGAAFFQNAHNLVFKNSNMVGAQHVYMEPNDRSPDVLLWLKEYTMTGAEYDSSVRNPPPRCHPGTRTTIIRKIFDWLGGPQQGKKLFWLRGPAGVGKSAVVQTLAENLSKSHRLGASLFFSRRRGCTNPSQILPTLAYRFAVQDPAYRAYITEVMLADPKMLEKAMSEQFEILIVEPFASEKVRSGQEIWIITLDGLDECGEDSNGERHSDRVQCDIVRLIGSFTRKYPMAPLMWIIASRPETHLKAVFSGVDILPSLWEEEILADSTEACKDVEQYLYWEFMKIRQNYPDHIHKSPWPASDQLLKIANTALGLFIFAEVIVRFIDDPSVGNPIGQLERVLSAISKVPTSKQENPLAVLDAVYIGILSKIPSDMLQVTKRLIGSFICLESHHIGLPDCDLRQTCNYLEITRGTAVTALRYLHSVIYFHKVEDIGQTRPRFYHAAFKDFLEDPSRSHEYFIDREEVVIELFQGIIRTAQAQFSSKPTPLPSWSDDERTEPPGSFITDCLHSVFEGDMSSDGVFTTFHDMRCFLSDAQFQLLLESLSTIKLLQRSLETVGLLIDIPRLSTSKPREATLRELRRRGFLAWTTFGSLGIDWEAASVSVAHPHSWVRIVHVDEKGSPTLIGTSDEDALVLREFRRFAKVTPQLKVMIFGHKKSEHCLVIQREDLRDVWTGVTSIMHCFITGISLATA